MVMVEVSAERNEEVEVKVKAIDSRAKDQRVKVKQEIFQKRAKQKTKVEVETKRSGINHFNTKPEIPRNFSVFHTTLQTDQVWDLILP